MIKSPEKTCALVVAIDNYEWGVDWDLPGATIGARKFIDCLKKLCVNNIHFYHGRGGTDADNFPRARVDDIRGNALLTALRKQNDCDCLIIYWAGHGCEIDGKRYVYLQDATRAVEKCFAVDDIIKFLNVETTQFTQQIVFFDTCAVDGSNAAFTVENIPAKKDKARPREDNHYFFAAATGEDTKYPALNEPSLFTQKLLELLGQVPLPTAEEIGNSLEFSIKGSHRIGRRDGRSPYWAQRGISDETYQRIFEAIKLEREVLRIAEGIPLAHDDPRWQAAARRIRPDLGWQKQSLPLIVQSFAGISSLDTAAELAVTLLLRGSGLMKVDIRKEILDSAILKAAFSAAEERVNNLFTFRNPRYLVKTAYLLGSGDLRASGVWFYAEKGAESGRRLSTVTDHEELDSVLGKITADMELLSVSDVVICLVVPLAELLTPPSVVLDFEKEYPIIFRWRERSESLYEFRFKGPKLLDRLGKVRARVAAAKSASIQWVNPSQIQDLADDAASIDFPAFRTGTASEDDVKTLLGTLIPFAAFTRPSIAKLAGGGDETILARTLKNETDLANFPNLLHKSRSKQGCLLSHLTILWDDRDDVPLPKGYSS